ncbi:syntaxinsyntaxin-4 [Podarcis lilfordi]|uniref:Syntaxinsyntaxin-4 n=1 Tax=Podarcis lilfordi TaxID=74358 RepID=A0AA35L8C2_9SAUR|nr:syntaxinsyntaxin-4 [Podarcis lilfordi]
MRDRTDEIRGKDVDSDCEETELDTLVPQPGSARPNGSPDPTDEFFRTTRGIREALKTLGSKVKDLEKHQTTILATPLPEDSMKQDLQKLREEIKELAKDIRTRLKKIEPKKDGEDENKNSINVRMKRTQHGILSQQFLDLINQCNATQSDYRDKNLERIRRQLQISECLLFLPTGSRDDCISVPNQQSRLLQGSYLLESPRSHGNKSWCQP